ncbi:MAG: putative toxin-antitoxin system toxin component, PIN family [Bacteroidota bacterium]
MTDLRVVIDTNVLLVSISSRSSLHWIYQALIAERYQLLVSSAILLEYEELIARNMGTQAAEAVMGLLEEGIAVERVDPRYNWYLIKADPDDDKFVDCAIAGQADCIVTYDRHFEALRQVDFPQVEVVSPEAFRARLAN